MATDKPKCPVINTTAGVPMADNLNSLTAGVRVPAVVTLFIHYILNTVQP